MRVTVYTHDYWPLEVIEVEPPERGGLLRSLLGHLVFQGGGTRQARPWPVSGGTYDYR